jgi:hypothetical protein
MATFIFRNQSLELEFDRGSGALVRSHLQNGETLSRWRLVDGAGWETFNGEVSILPQSTEVVL